MHFVVIVLFCVSPHTPNFKFSNSYAKTTNTELKMACCPKRLVIGIMLFFGAFFMYMLRANFSVLMLAMTNARDENGTLINKPDVSGGVTNDV